MSADPMAESSIGLATTSTGGQAIRIGPHRISQLGCRHMDGTCSNSDNIAARDRGPNTISKARPAPSRLFEPDPAKPAPTGRILWFCVVLSAAAFVPSAIATDNHRTSFMRRRCRSQHAACQEAFFDVAAGGRSGSYWYDGSVFCRLKIVPICRHAGTKPRGHCGRSCRIMRCNLPKL